MPDAPTISAQSTTMHVAEAIAQLKSLVENDEIYHRGQFAWAWIYEEAFRERIETAIPSGHPLHSSLLGISLGNPTSLIDRMMAACRGRDLPTYQALHKDITDVVEPFHAANPTDTGGNWLFGLLARDRGTVHERAIAAHDTATAEFSRGKRFQVGSQERLTWCDERLHGFRACFRVYARAAERCATLAVNMGLHLYSRKWKSDQRQREAKPRLGYFRAQGTDTDDKFDQGASPQPNGHGQIIGYSTELARVVRAACDALDRGYLLTASVISGVRKDHAGGQESEHSITIIGHDASNGQITFAFWDPDALASNGEFSENGFGLLYYDDAQMCAGGPFATQHKNGRLTTAQNTADLRVDAAGDHLAQTERHRYQPFLFQYVVRT